MGKIRDHFNKIRDIKGKFLAKMCSIKDKNGMDLTDGVKRIMKRGLQLAFQQKEEGDVCENNGMEKTRDLFKKIRDTTGTFPAKMAP